MRRIEGKLALVWALCDSIRRTCGLAGLIILATAAMPEVQPGRGQAWAATTRNVPSQYATIQAAITASSDGDTVIVAPGRYTESINLGGKNITLRSSDPLSTATVAATIIDGAWKGSVVIFKGTEGSTCTVSGFTLTQGKTTSNGAGVLGNSTHATLERCVIVNNVANNGSSVTYGGGIYGVNGVIQDNTITSNTATHGGGLSTCLTAQIRRNRIYGNHATASGGGIRYCGGTIEKNAIFNNTAESDGGGVHSLAVNTIFSNNLVYGNTAKNNGGGIYDTNYPVSHLNNTIYGNASRLQGGGYYASIGDFILRNNILWNNAATTYSQTYFNTFNARSQFAFNCVQDLPHGGNNNISIDPQFSNPAAGDFHLLATSPCIDAGSAVTLATDYEGNPRAANCTEQPRGDLSDVDLGAFELIGPVPLPVSPSVPAPSINPNPISQTMNVDLGQFLSWQDGSTTVPAAISYAVYLGTQPNLSSNDYKGEVSSPNFIPGALLQDKAYFWRVVPRNANGFTPPSLCPVWSFFTPFASLPEPPSGPTPADMATTVSINAPLTWQPSPRATGYKLYWTSTIDKLPYEAAQATVTTTSARIYNKSFSFGRLLYWRVVPFNENGSTPLELCPIWSFTYEGPKAPSPAWDPTPVDGAARQPLRVVLGWHLVPGASSYQVWFGAGDTSSALRLLGTTVETAYDTGALKPGTNYVWRIVPTQGSYVTPTDDCPIWRFQTRALSDATTLRVPQDYGTLQGAIDAASDLDTVMVAPGRYYENINLRGKNIILRSTDPLNAATVAATIIDGRRAGSVVTFSGQEIASCTMSGFTITNGFNSLSGGGIYGNSTKATIEHNTIIDNDTYGPGPAYLTFGGGIVFCSGTIQDNMITSNSASEGGGGMYGCQSGLIRRNQITGNHARVGGGMHSCGGTIDSNTISGNRSDANGAGIAWLTNNTTFTNNVVSYNKSSYYGGGIAQNSVGSVIQNNLFTSNTALSGGGFYGINGSKILNNTISYNYASSTDGGGLASCGGLIDGNWIIGNSTKGNGGGVSSLSNNSTFTNNVVSANTAATNGGGINSSGTGTVLANNTISSNTAKLYGGGLASCQGGQILHNTIRNNYASSLGGGFYNCGGTIDGNLISANLSGGGGGGMYSSATTTSTLTNNLFYENIAKNVGGAISNYTYPIKAINNTFYGNSAVNGNGAIQAGVDGMIIKNSIFWNNTAPANPQLNNRTASSPTYCCIQGWTSGGSGNITTAPLFVNAAAGDLHLQAVSPCIDAGGVVALTTDYDGNSRPFVSFVSRGDNSHYDMGAFEYSMLTPAVPSALTCYGAVGCLDRTKLTLTNLNTTTMTVTGFNILNDPLGLFSCLTTMPIKVPPMGAYDLLVGFRPSDLNSVTGPQAQVTISQAGAYLVNLTGLAYPATVGIVNPSFEQPVFDGMGLGDSRVIPGWQLTPRGGVGIAARNNPHCDNGLIPDGGQVLWMQGAQSVSQDIGGLVPETTYHISMYVNARAFADCQALMSVSMGGTPLFGSPRTIKSVQPYGWHTRPFSHLEQDFVANSTTMTLTIAQPNPPDDSTLLVDNIQITHLPDSYLTATYLAGVGGTVDGATSVTQMVESGASGKPVTAYPNTGYRFVQWSDGRADNPRTDLNLTQNITVTASFASNAAVMDSFNANLDGGVMGFAIQPDGRIVLGGPFTWVGGKARNGVARINADGSLDSTFDPGSGADGPVRSVILQPDGKVLVGGYYTSFSGVSRNRITRLNADGSLDTSFDPGTGADDTIDGLALQPDGKILLGGNFTHYNGMARGHIARLNADGSLDTTFNPGTGANWAAMSFAIQPEDGKIVVGGWFDNYNGVPCNHLVRLNADGSLDSTFNAATTATEYVFALLLQPDGKILVGVYNNHDDSTVRRLVMRLNRDGSLDSTFTPGAALMNQYWHSSGVNTMVLQANGKVLVGGSFSNVNGTARNSLVRFNPDGSLDASFAPENFAEVAWAGVANLALQADGKVLASGMIDSLNVLGPYFMAQLSNPDASSQTLAVAPGGKSVTWTLGGSYPQPSRVYFEHSDDGASWNALGWGGISSETNYSLSGLNLPVGSSHYLRASAWVPGGLYSSSSSILQSVLSFTAAPASTPAPAISPAPADDATDQDQNLTLGWQDGGGATSYQVYFGSETNYGPGAYRTTTSETSYNPGPLQGNTTYLWQIIPQNDLGNTPAEPCPVWRFSTGLTKFTVNFQTDGTPEATLSGESSQTVAQGASCTAVTANVPAGYHFVNWTRDDGEYSTQNPLIVSSVTESMTLTAHYAAGPSVQIHVQPAALNFGDTLMTVATQAKLVLGATAGFGNLTLNSLSIQPAIGGQAFAFLTTPTLPMTFSSGQISTFTLVFRPMVSAGICQSTLTLTASVDATSQTICIPMQGKAIPIAPGFIPVTSTTQSSSYLGGIGIHSADNRGILAEPMVGMKSALHNGTFNDMWLGVHVAQDWIQYDLGTTHAIAEMWVWNYNHAAREATGPYSQRGMKNVLIKYSDSPQGPWTTLADSTFTLAQAPGTQSMTATNQLGGEPIKFGGAVARYVRIESAGGPGIGNFYPLGSTSSSLNVVGLSEVRFYEAAAQPYVQPGTINFGSSVIGNHGKASIGLGALGGNVTLTGVEFQKPAQPQAFSFTTTPTLPLEFAAGEITTYTLSFTPLQAGDYQSTLTLHVVADAKPLDLNIPVSGSGYTLSPHFIPGVTVTADLQFDTNRVPSHLTDNSGMNESLAEVGSKTATMNASDYASAMWMTPTVKANHWVEFDLQMVKKLSEMWVWNFNMNSGTDFSGRGMRHVYVQYKVNSTDAWTNLGGIYELARATGQPGCPATNQTNNAGPIQFNGVRARYVRIIQSSPNTNDGNWGQNNYAGLSEVRFYEDPTPLPAINPMPFDGATSQSVNVDLLWRPNGPADGYNVYFGTNPTPGPSEYKTRVTTITLYDPGVLEPNTTYYWQVIPENGEGLTPASQCPVWHFSTASITPQTQYYRYNSIQDFSATQGYRNWYYGWRNVGEPYQQMTQYAHEPTWGPSDYAWWVDMDRFWTLQNPSIMHPNYLYGRSADNPDNQEPIRRFLVPCDGIYSLNLNYKMGGNGGDGTIISIEVNGLVIWSYNLQGNETDLHNVKFDLSCRANDTIDVIVNAKSEDNCDGTYVDLSIDNPVMGDGNSHKTYYVSSAVSASGDGLTPATAFKTIMEAMNTIRPTNVPYNMNDPLNDGCTVKVAAGTYRETVVFPAPGTTLLGGYTADFSARDWQANPTIIDGSDASVMYDGVAKCHQCVILNSSTPNGASSASPWGAWAWLPLSDCTIDGFKITGGGAGEIENQGKGGGIYAYQADNITLKNLEISNCDVSAGGSAAAGGGIYLESCNTPALDSIEIHHCQLASANTPFAEMNRTGAGLYIMYPYNLTLGRPDPNHPVSLTNLNIHDNFGGNGAYINTINTSTNPNPGSPVAAPDCLRVYWKIWDCKFWNCVTTRNGGGMCLANGIPVIYNGECMATAANTADIRRCQFYNNTAIAGAGLYIGYCDTATVLDCSFSNNKSDSASNPAGALTFQGGNGSLTVDRCVFAGNWCGSPSSAADYDYLHEPYGAYGAALSVATQDGTLLPYGLIRNCLFVGNHGARGVISFNGASSGWVFANNTVSRNIGKGDTVVYVQANTKVKMANNIFSNNQSGVGRRSYDAAVIRQNGVWPEPLELDRNLFDNNYFTSGSYMNNIQAGIVHYTQGGTDAGSYIKPVVAALSAAGNAAEMPPQDPLVPTHTGGRLYTTAHLPHNLCTGGLNQNFEDPAQFIMDGAAATTGTWTSEPLTSSSSWGREFSLRTANTMTLTDANAHWAPGALAGKLVFVIDPVKRPFQPYPYLAGNNRNRRAAGLILGNTEKAMVVTGRFADYATNDTTVTTAAPFCPPDYAVETSLTGMPYRICDYHLAAGSPAIDSGDAQTGGNGDADLDGNVRVQGGGVDLGAFEFAGASGPVNARRTLPALYTPTQAVPVTLAVAPLTTVTTWSVQEQPPAGWTVESITPGGTWDSVQRLINWGPFTGAEATTLSYRATPPAAASGTKRFQGSLSQDGVSQAIGGQNLIGCAAVPTPAPFQYAPYFIPGVTATSDCAYRLRLAANVTNNSGMSDILGPVVGLSNATQDTAAGSMWLSTSTKHQHWIEFNLNTPINLNAMYIWNYNENGYDARGLKHVYIKYKLNAADAWSTLTTGQSDARGIFTFARVTANTSKQYPSNLALSGNPPVNFSGLLVQYIRIEMAGGPGDGNYTSDYNSGLSEVRFYGARNTAPADARGFIPGVSATTDSAFDPSNRPAANLTNHSGMSDAADDYSGRKTATTDANSFSNWMSSIAGVPHWAEFDLGVPYHLNEMWVWNCTMTSGNTGRGFRRVYVQYKLHHEDPWMTLGGAGKVIELAKASGSTTQTATNQNLPGNPPINFGGALVQYVRIIQISAKPGEANWYTNDNFSGLGEVRFYGTESQTVPLLSPNAINFGGVYPYTNQASAALVIKAVGGAGSIQLTNAAVTSGSRMTVQTMPALPLTLNSGQATTLTLRYNPTEAGIHYSTLTLTLLAGGIQQTKLVPMVGVGQRMQPNFIQTVTCTASSGDGAAVVDGITPGNMVGSQVMLGDSVAAVPEVDLGTTTALSLLNTACWLSGWQSTVSTQYLDFDLGSVYPLGQMWVWNYHYYNSFQRDIKQCAIWYRVHDTDPWTSAGTYVLKKSSNSSPWPATNLDPDGKPITFSGVQARYVRLQILSNYDATHHYVGCTEVRFYASGAPVGTLPAPATSPTPADGSSNQALATRLAWQNGGGATAYRVYFGPENNFNAGSYRETTVNNSFDPGPLEYGTTYLWQIIPQNDSGSAVAEQCPVWRFRTRETLPAPLIDLDASSLTTGQLQAWNSVGSTSGDFTPQAGATGVITVADVAGRRAVVFPGTIGLQSNFTAPAGLTGTNPWTVSVWVYNPVVSDQEVLVSTTNCANGPSNQNFWLGYGSNATGAVCNVSTGLGWERGIPAAGQWHHIVCTYQGGAWGGWQRVWVDGVINAQATQALNLLKEQPIRIGFTDRNNRWLSGAIARVQAFDTELTDNQIRRLHLDGGGTMPDTPQVINSSFEAPSYTSGLGPAPAGTLVGGLTYAVPGWARYSAASYTTAWTQSRFPVSHNANWDNGASPEGGQVMSLWDGADVAQYIDGFKVGRTYRVAFRANAKSGSNVPRLDVKLNGVSVSGWPKDITAVEPAGSFTQPFTRYSFDWTAPADGGAWLQFSELTVPTTAPLQGQTGYAVLLDKVRVTDLSQPANAELSASTINYYAVHKNTSKELGVVVTNAGGQPLSITGASISGSDAALYATTSTLAFPVKLEAGEEQEVRVRFLPVDYGDFSSATLQLATNAGPVTVALQGFCPKYPTVVNNSFEWPVYPGDGSGGDNINIPGWSGGPASGIGVGDRNNPQVNNGAFFDGYQALALRNQPGVTPAVQTVSQLIAGFHAGQRCKVILYVNACATGDNQARLRVLLGGTELTDATITASGNDNDFDQPYTRLEYAYTPAADQPCLLEIQSLTTNDNGAVLIDKVAVIEENSPPHACLPPWILIPGRSGFLSTTTLPIINDGGSPLSITSCSVTGDARFGITAPASLNIPAYCGSESIHVGMLAASAGEYGGASASLSFAGLGGTVLVPLKSRVADEPLVENASFELPQANASSGAGGNQVIAGWTAVPKPSLGTYNTAWPLPPAGRQYLWLAGAEQANQFITGFVPGKTYHISIWANAQAAGDNKALFQTKIGGIPLFDGVQTINNNATAYQHLEQDFVANATGMWLELIQPSSSDTGQLWLDNIQLSAVTAPQPAVSPTPPDNATEQPANVTLAWQNGGGATVYQVYLATEAEFDASPCRLTTAMTSYDPGPLQENTTYLWRIVPRNASGSTPLSQCPIWRFTTAAAPATTNPTVTVSGPASPTNLSPITFTITFSEAVSGLSLGGVTVSGGAKGALTESGTGTYQLTVAPSGQGEVSCQVPADAAVNGAGLGNTASNELKVSYDSLAPVVTLTTTAPEPTTSSPIPVQVEFSEPVLGLEINDLTTTNGTASALSGSGSSYTFDLIPNANGPVTVAIAAGAAHDAAGNGNYASGSFSHNFIQPVLNTMSGRRYSTLQDAVDAASPSDILKAGPWTYTEAVVIGVPLTLSSEAGTTTTIIDGGIRLAVSGITVEGFTIKNGHDFGAGVTGIQIDANTTTQTIANNVLIGLTLPSQAAPRMKLRGASATRTEAQPAPSAHGIIMGSNCGEIDITGNSICGWTTGLELTSAKGVLIGGNVISQNYTGIRTEGLTDAVLSKNQLSDNSGEGWATTDVGTNVVSELNVYQDNGVAINNVGSKPLDCTNSWWGDPSGPSGGLHDPITDRAAEGQGNPVGPNVLFDPWLLAPPPVITVNAPRGREVWSVGSTRTIRWTSTNLTGAVRVQVSFDGGSSWQPIAKDQPVNGSLAWKVTPALSTQVKVRVVSQEDAAILGESGMLTIAPNHSPLANGQAVFVDEDKSLPITLIASDGDGDALSYHVAALPKHGTFDTTRLTYTPELNYNGPDCFTFLVNDGQCDSPPAEVTITVNPVNDAPVAQSQALSAPAGKPARVALAATDMEGDPLTYSYTQPAHGTLSGSAPNLIYTSAPDYSGTDSFTFKVNDGQLDSQSAVVTLAVNPVNNAPVAQSQALRTSTGIPVPVMLAATDVEGDQLTYIFTTQPAHGTLSGSAPNLVYTPTFYYHGTDSFTFKAKDGQRDSEVATVSITIDNDISPGMILLAPYASNALSLTGSASLSAAGGVIQVNSSSGNAVGLGGSASLAAEFVNVVGNLAPSVRQKIQANLINCGVSALDNPLVLLPPPASAQDQGRVSLSGSQSLKIEPGYYSGGIKAGGSGTLTLAPGIYVLDGVGLQLSGNVTLTGKGVMLYLKGTGQVNISGSAEVTLTPLDPEVQHDPGNWAYSGITIFQAPGNVKDVTINGANRVSISGILYCPAAHVCASNSAGKLGTLLICNTFSMAGNGTIELKE